jgi:hypothetical protein
VVLAFASMIAGATASAAEVPWEFLPGSKGETFTGKLHAETKATLQEVGNATFKCSQLEILLAGSELTGPKEKDSTEAIAALHFSKCESAGLALNSKGDASGVILTNIDMHTCLIEWLGKPKQDGVLILPLGEVVLEALKKPITIVLDTNTAGFVAPLKKIGVSEYLLDVRQKEGVQEVKLCEGGVENSLKALLAGVEKEVNAGEELKAIIKFDKTKDKEEELF